MTSPPLIPPVGLPEEGLTLTASHEGTPANSGDDDGGDVFERVAARERIIRDDRGSLVA